MSNFEWQTEDNSDWEDDPVQVVTKQTASRRRVASLVGLLVLVLVVGAVIYTQLQATVEEAVAASEAELEATALLLYQSAENGDADIFLSLLSGADREWSVGYQMQLAEGGLLGLDAFGLSKLDKAPVVSALQLSPDLLSAEITTTIDYSFPVGNGITETVTLDRPSVFRKGETRWLFAPPDQTYWGETVTRITAWGFASYPGKDEQAVAELVDAVDLAFRAVCTNAGARACSTSDTIVLFATEPTSIPFTMPPLSDYAYNSVIRLPTISLLGLPTTEAEKQALTAGYARLIFRALMVRSLQYGGPCCKQPLYFDALVELMLMDQGLAAVTFSEQQYQTAYDRADLDFLVRTYQKDSELDEDERIAATIWLDYFRQRYPALTTPARIDALYQNDDPIIWMHQSAVIDDPSLVGVSAEIWAESHFADYRLYLQERISSNAGTSVTPTVDYSTQ